MADMKIIGGVRVRAEHVPEGTKRADIENDRDRTVKRRTDPAKAIGLAPAAATAEADEAEAPARRR